MKEWIMTETLKAIDDYYNNKYKLAKDLSHDMFVIVDYGYYFNQGVVCDKFTDTGVKIYFPELESYLYVSNDTPTKFKNGYFIIKE